MTISTASEPPDLAVSNLAVYYLPVVAQEKTPKTEQEKQDAESAAAAAKVCTL